MIELTMEDLLLWMVGVPLVWIGLVSLLGGLKRRARARAKRRQVVRCRICGHVFRDISRDRSLACPQCQAVTERGESRRLG